MNEIEALLSKMSDSVNTLSLNPLGISMGDRVDSAVDTDITGAILNIEVFMRYYSQYSNGEINVTELSKLCGMSRTTVYKYIRLIQK